MGDARKTRREKGAPVFCGGWKNICIHPRPSSRYIGRAIPRYRLRRLHIPKFRQPKRLSYRASAFSSLHSIPYPFPSLFPPFSFISACAPVSLSFSSSLLSFSLSVSVSLCPSFHETILILSLFSSRWRNVHQKICILRRIVYDSVSRTFRHCARMTRGQREKLRAVLNECEKKRRGDDGDGRNLH